MVEDQVDDFSLDDRDAVGSGDLFLHSLAVESAVALASWPLHRRASRSVQQPKLDAGAVRDPAHDPVQCVDFAHQVPFADAADRGVAGHLADAILAVRYQQDSGPKTMRGMCGLGSSVAAANDKNIPGFGHVSLRHCIFVLGIMQRRCRMSCSGRRAPRDERPV